MKQAQYWMLTKRKHSFSSHLQASIHHSAHDDSWEEQAFAKDAAGLLGWPPRSYSCSFCRREFRSAQALGGHMNVHRRDRARLKQSPMENIHNPHHQNHVQTLTCASLAIHQHPANQVCTLLYNPPNPNSDPVSKLVPPSSQSRVSTAQKISSDQTNFSPRENYIKKPSTTPLSFWSNLAAEKYSGVSDPKVESEKNSKTREVGCKEHGDFVKSNLSMSLNLFVHRTSPSPNSASIGNEESTSCKKRRIEVSPLPFFLKQASLDRNRLQSEVIELNPRSLEDLDLELRLGDRPKVK